MASFSSSSSSSSSASYPLNYDIFLNFRGEDTRRKFTSHLYATLRQKDLQTFFDNDNLKSGEEIAQSLRQAIKDSTVVVPVFSKNYASSSWCLDELAEIVECYRTHGQIVMPVFYEVDPSHLRKQSHNVATAFVKHKQNPKNTHKIQRWKDALITAASLRGFNSKEFRSDHMLIKKIVTDILKKLNHSKAYDDFEHLVGMDSRIEGIKEVFTIDPLEIRILGIYGTGGVGKTTTAEVIYHKMSHQFQSSCFVYNVRQQTEAGAIKKLQKELISKALGKVKYTFSAGPGPLLIKKLGHKKMLIVLDDVNDPLQLEYLIGNPCWFGLGSMIIITSRHKQVFEGRANFIYELKPLNHVEALQVFNKSAFKQEYPGDNYVSLSNSIVKYSQGNPLALKVLGSALIGKKHDDWKNTVNQLSKAPNKDIQHVTHGGLWNLENIYKAFIGNKEVEAAEAEAELKEFLSQQLQQLLKQRLHPSVHPHLAAVQSQTYGAHHSSSHIREPKHESSQRGRQSVLSSQQGSDISGQNSDSGWVQFRSKYMTAEEIESIVKMHHTSTHSKDPYIDDYYHQANLAKRLGSKHHFCPSQLEELPCRFCNSLDQHCHVHGDALGKIPIPSIHCSLSLLEIDPSGSDDGSSEHIFKRPLERETLLAARSTIEDCLVVLLDVKDIDRFLRHNQPQDGGSYLGRKRKVLLEAVAASLHLVDPLGQSGKTVGLVLKDDLVFLRLVSLPKGQKLISEFLKLLSPGSELTRIVCMAVLRNLRFFFGGISPDSEAAETTGNLVKIVSTCFSVMDLGELTACLAAVVCSTEQPPFRPTGSPTS